MRDTATPPDDVAIENVVTSTSVRSSDPAVESPKEYEFSFRGDRFRLDRSGRFTCRTGTTERGTFQLDLQELPFVEELKFVPYGENVLVLLYELSDGEGGLSRIGRIYLPNCELVLTSDLPGFNLGPAVLEQSSLYVTVIGFVGKFDVETWGFEWTHGNLYDRHQLNAFGAPTVYRDRVVFPEITTFTGSLPRNVIVEKSSGAIQIVAQRPATAP